MDQQQIIADIETRARRAGLTIAAVCARAGVHPTTFSRWKQTERNPEPIGATLKTLDKLNGAIDELEAQAAA